MKAARRSRQRWSRNRDVSSMPFYKGIVNYLRYFNEERPHQGLDNRTPDDLFCKRKPLPKAA